MAVCLMGLAEQIAPDLVLLMSSPHLTESKVADMSICSGCLKPPFAKGLFHVGHLYLLFKEVNLHFQALALFVHRLVVVDLSHKPPVIGGELVKGMSDHCKGGSTPHQHR